MEKQIVVIYPHNFSLIQKKKFHKLSILGEDSVI